MHDMNTGYIPRIANNYCGLERNCCVVHLVTFLLSTFKTVYF